MLILNRASPYPLNFLLPDASGPVAITLDDTLDPSSTFWANNVLHAFRLRHLKAPVRRLFAELSQAEALFRLSALGRSATFKTHAHIVAKPDDFLFDTHSTQTKSFVANPDQALNALYQLVWQKYTAEPFKTILLNTLGQEIVYESETDMWLGKGKSSGDNIYGKMLSHVRDQIQTYQQAS